MGVKQANIACARFFIRIGQVGRATEPRDPYTLPLFSLFMTLETEGLLSAELRWNPLADASRHGHKQWAAQLESSEQLSWE